MEVIAAVGAWAMRSMCESVPAADSWLGTMCRTSIDLQRLGSKLSPEAEIAYPGSDLFNQATTRWSALHNPKVNVVVIPTTANDVAETVLLARTKSLHRRGAINNKLTARQVKFANSLNVPFLAVNAGHGGISTQGNMKNGIEIWMDKLSTIEIARDGKTVKFGGGTWTKALVDALWDSSKQTVTGGCQCTSILGPGLGGGHGLLQGRHGLISDQFVSLDLVLSDGTLQTIDSSSDLWWAMQGAGHNFGIVTSATMKIYEIEHANWAYQSYIFTGDKVEVVYRAINDHFGGNTTRPVDVMNFSIFLNIPDMDPTKPLIMLFIFQEGASVVERKYTAPFNDLGPLHSDGNVSTYRDIPELIGASNASPLCQKRGLAHLRFPLDLLSYDVQAQRDVYDHFASVTQKTPALNGSAFLFEGFSLQGVQTVASDSTAYPFRSDKLLVSPVITYQQGGADLDRQAAEFGASLRQILHKASGRDVMHTYVNYASGDENRQNWYGAEHWRQEKLLKLKKKYDPHGKFNFYAPITK